MSPKDVVAPDVVVMQRTIAAVCPDVELDDDAVHKS